MSSSVSSRPLPLIPFIAADAVLLLTALLIAWRTTGELAGGALLGVVVCTALGAVLAVFPFILNDVHERELSLAERQRELVELVNTSTASASRWGTQWAAAATGLEDAAALAARSLAAADHLPVVFQEKIDALSTKLDAIDRAAQLRADTAGGQAANMAAQAEQLGAMAAGLQQTLLDLGQIESRLDEQRAAISAALEEFPAAAERADAARKEWDERLSAAPAALEERFASVSQQAESRLAALLAEFPAATAQVGAEREALERRLASVPAEIEARISAVTTQAENRLAETTSGLTARLTEVETLLTALTARLQNAIEAPLPQQTVIAVPAMQAVPAAKVVETPVAPVAPVVSEEKIEAAPAPSAEPAESEQSANDSVASVRPAQPAEASELIEAIEAAKAVEVPVEQAPVGVQEVQPAARIAKAEKEPVRSDAIMDPFIIPDNGYDALAAAMDSGGV